MAILKAITDNKGQITSYHRIAAFAPVFDGEQKQLNVNLASYTSEQYRDMEKSGQAQNMQVASTGIVLPLREDDIYSRASIYESIMAMPEFEGATEV